MRCSNTRTTSRSNASAKAANRARRWRRWRGGPSGRRTRSSSASQARSCRSWTRPNWTSRRCWRSTTPDRATSAAGLRTGSRRRSGSNCVRISQLEGKRVALWGWGREGRAAYAALRRREPGTGNREAEGRGPLPLTLFCAAHEAEQARALGDPAQQVETGATAERLACFDVVVKSPGISPYRPEAVAARERGTTFIGGTALWFAERP